MKPGCGSREAVDTDREEMLADNAGLTEGKWVLMK